MIIFSLSSDKCSTASAECHVSVYEEKSLGNDQCSKQNRNEKVMYIDPGTGSHLLSDKSLFTEFEYNNSPTKVILADGKILH